MNRFEPSDIEKAERHATPPTLSPSTPVHPSPSGTEAPANDGEVMHPVMQIMQEKELGKFLLASAIAILGIVVAGRSSLAPSKIGCVLVLVSIGFTAILYGILLKATFPVFSQMVEAVGIALVAVSFFAIVAFFMPAEFLWAPALCFVLLCLLPFFILLWQPANGG